MFQFPGFASAPYEFRCRYCRSSGFPHSDISGSKPVCRLPEAFRRLLRPSSPLAAKASTVCAYSLDHITPKRRDHMLLLGSLCQCNIPRLNVKNVQSIRISHKNIWLFWRLYIHHCPNCKRTICLATSKDRKQQMNLPLLISGLGVGGASRDRTGDP